MTSPSAQELLAAARIGFSGLSVHPSVQEAALDHLARWLHDPHLIPYRGAIVALVEAGRWSELLDSFRQRIPFGTGGCRGPVGVGPNRFNTWTLGTTVQGHAHYLRRIHGDAPISVVLACDVRRFGDRQGRLAPGGANPVLGMSSRDFAEIAAEVYAAHDIQVWLPADGGLLSTPELSHAIRVLHAAGGANISASHNPPDDNGVKIYNAGGGQVIPPVDERIAEAVAASDHVDRMPLDRARAAGLVRDIGPEVHEAYLATNLAVSRSPTARSARVVFTPLHGTGTRTVAALLERAGFEVEVEPSQAEPDGDFPGVPFGAPNPELPGVLDAAIATAERRGADLVLACDPDADRLGLAAREHLPAPDRTDPVRWRTFSGNEIGALVASYLLSRRSRTTPPLVFKTEVTSSLVSRVAQAHGARVVGHLLVGFKYIGAALDEIEAAGRTHGIPARLDDFVLGAEESHGLLVTPALRDKDAAGAALVLAELASVEKDAGRTLVDTLRDLWARVGYVGNLLVSAVMQGAEGRERIAAIQRLLRESPPERIGERAVTAFHDRQDERGPFGPIRSETDRASRDVLVFELGEDARVVVRPSGTEPKTKVYVEVAGRPGASPSTERPRVNAEVRALADAFLGHMLGLVGLHPPAWALRASDLVAVEHKVDLAEQVVPELVRRLEAPDRDVAATRAWLARRVAPYGRDPLALIAPAVRAYVDAERPACGHALLSLLP